MAKECSLDICSIVENIELDNVVTQAMREIDNRFDFKGSVSKIAREGDVIKLVSDDEGKLKSVIDILESKLIKRSISIKFLDFQSVDHALGGNVKQEAKIKNGISSEVAKEINKAIKASKIKVKSQIQGDQLRASSKSRDELQALISYLKEQDFGIELQFVNFR
mgnify:CR=1 FL=1|jgi:cyclic-di-GMP-binding protein